MSVAALWDADLMYRVRANMNEAVKVDIVSYNVHLCGHTQRMLNSVPTRLIIGITADKSEQAKFISKARSAASSCSRLRVKTLEESHTKLYIYHYPKGKTKVICGSLNLGEGHYHEAGVEISGNPAQDFVHHFQWLWNLAQPVKGLDLSAVVKMLNGEHYEVAKGTTETRPKPTVSKR